MNTRQTLRLLPLLALVLSGMVSMQSAAQGLNNVRATDGLKLPPLPGSAFPTQPTQNQPGPAANTGSPLDALMAWERQDMGVAPVRELHQGALHGPTPNQIPGGQVITTKGLLPLLQQGTAVRVFDVLGGKQILPNALPLAWAAQPGSFNDSTQQQLAQALAQATAGRNDVPLVFYCGGPQCWMSYNAALRAIHLGYRNVLWYRGGMEAWQRAGQQFAAASR